VKIVLTGNQETTPSMIDIDGVAKQKKAGITRLFDQTMNQ